MQSPEATLPRPPRRCLRIVLDGCQRAPWKAWYTKAVGDIGGVDVVGMYDLEKREAEERLPRDEWLAKALLGGKFDSYKKAPPPPAKKGGWSLRQLGRFRVKREAS